MEKATISQLRTHLGAYIKKVRAGESVLILDRKQARGPPCRRGGTGTGR